MAKCKHPEEPCMCQTFFHDEAYCDGTPCWVDEDLPEAARGEDGAPPEVDRYAEIRARYNATTPGEWVVVRCGNTVPSHKIISISGLYEPLSKFSRSIASGISPKTGNAAFIAAAHEDIPFLLNEIERLRSMLRDSNKEDKE